ncbi:MAG TPA: alpha-L-rhamnosidase C-terminal domain-containing protein [Acidobacteriaceae bacterium]
MLIRKIFLFLLTFLAGTTAITHAQEPREHWSAIWISHPTAPLREPIVLHFRKSIELPTAPQHYLVHVSGDRRFLFYVNGQRIGAGPAASDLPHWRYETFDLAPALHAGTNLLTATVWNFGIYSAISQMSDRTAFLVQGDTRQETAADTNGSWSVAEEPGITVVPRANDGRGDYMAASPGEMLDAAKYGWKWQQPDDGSLHWVAARTAMREDDGAAAGQAASERDVANIPWRLMPDQLPQMTYNDESPGAIVRAGLADAVASGFPKSGLTIPSHTTTQVLLDRKTLTTAFPELTFSDGRGSRVVLTYAEALYDAQLKKGNRNDIAGRHAIGFHDIVLPDGGKQHTFEPLWWRTWRYMQIDIETGDEPLTLEHLGAHESAYPFSQRALFDSADADLQRIWQIGWRTARLDAHETYMDTPYYEQLQYIGDTRIQALISYAVTGDDRLARQAIAAFANSHIPEGLTQSRYPSSLEQIIPPFSLYWIGMLDDLYWYRPDAQIVTQNLQGTRDVLAWFFGYLQPDGLLREPPYWNFVDWVPETEKTPAFDAHGESCLLSLELSGALRDASELERALGDPAVASTYEARLKHTREGIYEHCWSPERKLLADTPDRTVFSEHANILGVLYDVIPKSEQQGVMRRMVNDQEHLMPASYYFRFYLARALEHAGLGNLYLDSLGPWRELLPMGFSTWPEMPGDSRSDSHAWSAHPTYDLLTIVGGIHPGSPGFRTVRIAPELGGLKKLTVRYPHPLGDITAQYEVTARGLHAEIGLPAGLHGSFEWRRQSHPLSAGKSTFDLP